MRVPPRLIAPVLAILLAAPAAHAGSEAQPDLASPVNPNVDHWADATKFWVNETNGELQFWEEDAPAMAPADTACESADPFNCPTGSAYRQENAHFAFLMGFTVDGQPWHVVWSADPYDSEVPAGTSCAASNTAAVTRGSATFVNVYEGDKRVWGTDASTSGYSAYAPWVASQGTLARGMRWTTYTTALPPGTVLQDLWGATVVRCPQPDDHVPFTSCTVLPVFADQATDCVTSAQSFTLQGGVRAVLQNVTLSVSPASLKVAPGARASGKLTAVNQDSTHHSVQVKALAPSGWSVQFTPDAMHLAAQSSATSNWTLQVPANATAQAYNVTFELDDGYAVKDEVVPVVVAANATADASAGNASSPPGGSTASSPSSSSAAGNATTASSPSSKTPVPSWAPVVGIAVAMARRRRR